MTYRRFGRIVMILCALVIVGGLALVPASGPMVRTFAQDDEEAAVKDLVTAARKDLNTFWTKVFAQKKYGKYRPPRAVIAFTEDRPVDTPCGESEAGDAFYCSDNTTIYYDMEMMIYDYENSSGQGFVLVATMGHEWGHYVQDLLYTKITLVKGDYNLEYELQADCLAGAFIRFEYDGGGTLTADQTDVDESKDSFFESGDERGTRWDDPEAHGTGTQRGQAFSLGYKEGVDACLNPNRIATVAKTTNKPTATPSD